MPQMSLSLRRSRRSTSGSSHLIRVTRARRIRVDDEGLGGEVREVQTALGLVAAEAGVCLVPASVELLNRDNVVYRPLDEEKAVSPIIISYRKGDKSPEITLILKLIREIYREKARLRLHPEGQCGSASNRDPTISVYPFGSALIGTPTRGRTWTRRDGGSVSLGQPSIRSRRLPVPRPPCARPKCCPKCQTQRCGYRRPRR